MRAIHFPRLIIMTREPLAGRVKSRLARETGAVAAALAFRFSLAGLAARTLQPLRWQTLLSVTPHAALTSRMLPPRPRRALQGPGDLGVRMARAISHAPPGPVVLIGADIPAVTADDIALAFRLLGRYDVVLGPAGDGGYWLVGFRKRPLPEDVFRNVRWSTGHALADTVAGLAGWRVGYVATHPDFDDAKDLRRLRPVIGRRVLPRLCSEPP